MSDKTAKALEAVLGLSKEEQMDFLEKLHASLEELGVHPFEDDWSAEIERRSAEYDRGNAKTHSWEEVKAEVHREVAGDA